MRDSLQNWIPGLKGDPLYMYHRNQAKVRSIESWNK